MADVTTPPQTPLPPPTQNDNAMAEDVRQLLAVVRELKGVTEQLSQKLDTVAAEVALTATAVGQLANNGGVAKFG